MFELISLIAVVLAISALASVRGMKGRHEFELAALKLELKRLEALLQGERGDPDGVTSAKIEGTKAETLREVAEPEPVMAMLAASEIPAEASEPATADQLAELASTSEPVLETANPAPPAKPRESFEQRFAARWSVWVGGIALAFAGIFAVKYSIDQGFFSPEVRLAFAALFGLVLVAAGEWVRRRTTPLTESQFQNAMIPGVLTAAGTLTLFGAVFVAHGVYQFIGPAMAFILLAIISLGTLGLSLLHGQALAGVGLLTSFVTPLLVASGETRPWSLFGFLAVVWISSTLASRIRAWRVAPALANFGLSAWVFLYIVGAQPYETLPALLPMLIMVAGLAFLYPGIWVQPASAIIEPGTVDSAGRPIRPVSRWQAVFGPRHLASTLVAALGGLVIALVFAAPDLATTGYNLHGYAALVIALALFGALRNYAVYPAIFSGLAALGGIRIASIGTASGFNSSDPLAYTDPGLMIWLALGLGLFFAVLSVVTIFRRQEETPEYARVWALIGTVTPLALGTLSIFFFGDYSFDLQHGLFAIALGVIFLGGAYVLLGRPQWDGVFVPTREILVAGSWGSFVYALLVMTNGIATTIGIAAIGFVYLLAQRARNWPVLPWFMVASAIFVAGRFAWEPTIVGPLNLGKTPVFNALLAGYGIPTVLLIASAWLIRDRAGDRLRNAMEALASLFGLLTVAILVRHAMNGGVLDDSVPTLAEQSIYSLLCIGASMVLMTLDLRRPSVVFRYGSMAIGYLSMASILVAHFLTLNPYLTGESTGGIVIFNLLFLAYLLPGITYALASFYARNRRPHHYVVALALSSASLLFAYVTLSVRRIYHGADISEWKGFLQPELYTYSVVWLVLGLALLIAGYRFKARSIRIASAALVLIAVGKVFLIDMANLEGLYRVLSFIGLGVALIGIGRFYQTVLSRLEKQESANDIPTEPLAGTQA